MASAAAVVGVSESCAQRWASKAGGVIADLGEPSGRYLSLAEREQIAASLRCEYPDRPEMQVCHETVYQTLYVQGRGELRRELTRRLRTGRKLRQPRRIGERRGSRPIPERLNISARPAEVADRAVPGHWEGDLITGRENKTAVGTLVERHTRFVMPLHLPHGHGAG